MENFKNEITPHTSDLELILVALKQEQYLYKKTTEESDDPLEILKAKFAVELLANLRHSIEQMQIRRERNLRKGNWDGYDKSSANI